MKILHSIASVDPAGGGPIEGVKQLSSMAKLGGHEVEIVSLDAPDAPFLKSFPHVVHPLGPGQFTYGFSKRFVPWLRANASKFDVIVVNGIWQYQSFGVWRALRSSSTPYVVFTHGMLDPWFKRTYPLKHLKKWLYWPWGDYRVLRDAAAVLFTCEEERLLARQSFWLYKVQDLTVNYGTSAPDKSGDATQAQFLRRFPETGGKRLVLFMGRIHPKKGCDLVIKAFARILGGERDWHLVLAGPDQVGWRSELDALANRLGISEQITWTGLVSGDLKWELFETAEVLLLPSHQENFGIVVAEALACGLPALISNKVNIWREIEADGGGLVAADDLDGASSLLRTWLAMPDDDKAKMRESARDCFRSRFEIRRASSSLLNILAAVVEQNNSLNSTAIQLT